MTKVFLKNAKPGELEVGNGYTDADDGYFNHLVFINSYYLAESLLYHMLY